MIYSPKDVKQILDEVLKGVQRYDHTIDYPTCDCCSGHSTMEPNSLGAYVRFTDIEDSMAKIKDTL